MAQCPICQTEYLEGQARYCFTCGWDIIPYPLTFNEQIPEAFLEKEQAKLVWAKQMWARSQSLAQLSTLGLQITQIQGFISSLSPGIQELLHNVPLKVIESLAVKNPFLSKNIDFFKNEYQQHFTLPSLINSYSQIITEDCYIVGIESNGEPCISDLSKISHRMITGMTGQGKTNSILSWIYQLLYANSQVKIYVADFKLGLDYQMLAGYSNIKIVTEIDRFANLLESLVKEQRDRVELMISEGIRNFDQLRQTIGSQAQRIVLIVDEHPNLYSIDREVRKVIEKSLEELVTKGRVTGFHLIFCGCDTLIERGFSSFISNNIDERVVFRVSTGISHSLLNNGIAADLPVEPRGLAVYRGVESTLKIVATPCVPDEIWKYPLNDL